MVVLRYRIPRMTDSCVVCFGLQIEDGEEDHNVLAVVQGENLEVDHGTRTKLTNFVGHVFDHVRGKQIWVGKFLGVQEAEAQVLRCRDRV